MSQPNIETKATFRVRHLTLENLEQFLSELRDWPRDTEVVVQQHYGQRDQPEGVTVTATLRSPR